MPIDFTLSDQQNAIRGMVEPFATNVLPTASTSYEKYSNQKDRFQALRLFYRTAVGGGMVKGIIPQPLGGMAVLDSTILVEEMYKIDRSLSLAIFGTGLGLSPLFIAARETACKLGAFGAHRHGKLVAKGPKGFRTVPRKDGDDWVINGEKMWATNSSGWDDRALYVDSHRMAKTKIHQPYLADSIMILLVTRNIVKKNLAKAYEVLGHMEFPGHSSAAGPHVKLTDFRVPSG